MRNIYLISFLLLFGIAKSQTSGSSEVSSIESKAKQILGLEDKISKLQAERQQTFQDELTKLNLMKDDLERLKRMKIENEFEVQKRLDRLMDEIENSTSWKNRRESAESGWKEHNPGECGAGGPPPKCPVDHWYRVSVSVAMAEYEAYKQSKINEIKKDLYKYDDKIKAKENDINTFQFYDNEFIRKRKSIDDDINKARNDISRLRDEIVQHSRSFKNKILDETKSKIQPYSNDLMRTVAEIHSIEDRIIIYENKINELNNDEVLAKSNARQKVVDKNNYEIKLREEKIRDLKLQQNEIEKSFRKQENEFKTLISKYKSELFTIENELKNNKKLTEEERKELEQKKKELELKIDENNKELNSTKAIYVEKFNLKTIEIKKYDDEIWDLKINLPQKESNAERMVIEAYEMKRNILKDGKSSTNDRIIAKKTDLRTKEIEYDDKMRAYNNLIDGEYYRIYKACQSVGCSCYGSDAKSESWLIWSNSRNCISSMEQVRKGSVYYGCQNESQVYLSHYKNLQSGLSDKDKQNIQSEILNDNYQKILNKF
jgi:hypothetical protein